MTASASDLDRQIIRIAELDPSTASAKAAYAAQLEEGRAANTLSGPDIDFDYKFSEEGNDGNRWGFSVGQAFDWPGAYAARSRANGYRADAFAMLYRSALVDKALEIKTALIALDAADKRLELLREADRNLAALEEAYRKALADSQATVLDVKKIGLQRFSIGAALASAEAEAAQCRANLRTLTAGAASAGVDTDFGKPAFDLTVKPLAHYEELYAAADPAASANRSLRSAAEADVSAARRSALPSFKLAYVHDYEEHTHFNGFSIGISLPSWAPAKSVRAAKAASEALALEDAAYDVRRSAMLAADHAEASALMARVETSAATFSGDSYTGLLRKAFDARSITLLDYLREYNEYLDAEIEYISLRERLAAAVARLDRYDMTAR